MRGGVVGWGELSGLRDRSRTRLLGHEIVWIDRDGPELEVEVSRFVGWPLALHGRGRREAERVAAQALERVGARECMGRRWGELSNWQRVLVGLARAFAGSPRVVVIDDLLDALGARATEEASDLLRALDRGVRAAMRGVDERLGYGVGDVRRPGVVAHAQGHAEGAVGRRRAMTRSHPLPKTRRETRGREA